MNVRALWQAIRVDNAQAPYDTIQLKIFYSPSNINTEQASSVNSVNQLKALPIIIFFSGFNCNLAMYEWLAIELASRRFVVILFNWLIENIPGKTVLTPGINFAAFAPDVYNTIPSASALPLLLAELERLNTSSELAGLLDLEKIILGGHSAGGRIALENANTEFFPQVAAAFSYGSHTAAPSQMGYEPGTILPLPNSVPMLLLSGTEDGVIAKNSHIYGLEEWETPATPIIRTFREGFFREKGDSYLFVLKGANHFIISDRLDLTLEVTALDLPSIQPQAKIRSVIAEIIGLFIDLQVCQQSNLNASEQLDLLLKKNKSLIAFFEFK